MNFFVPAFLFSLAAFAPAWSALPEKIEFNRDVRPILADRCFKCHGFDPKTREADRRLDTRDGALAELDGVRALVPGDLAASEVHLRIHAQDDDDKMPPPKSGKTLNEHERAILDRWIEQGAEYQPHWAYAPLRRPAVPANANAISPIDAFVQARQKTLGLKLSPEADRATLLRRLSFDLTGLPPSPAEVDAFLKDAAPDAVERVVERLLASPAYGERMAVSWLDLVRYADSIGFHSDNPRNVAPFRDYVIRAFNENKPFDQFTIEQLAGDLLPQPALWQRVASGYNRLNLSTEEGGAQPKDYEQRTVADRVRSIGTTWLGQTTGCAQCHDHKFDPITARDFYRLGAFFADIKEPAIGRLEDGLPVPDAEQAAQRRKLAEQAAEWQAKLAAPWPPEVLAALQAQVASAVKERVDFERTLPHSLVARALPTPRVVRVLARGNWQDETGETVQPGVPAFLPQPANTDRRLTRLDLAQWLVAPENPLTARVFVNRLWKLFFGIGLSKVLDDVGAQGEPPVHPELLDWLASEFVASGWDVKRVARLIVTSAAYRQSSTAPRALVQRDPDNRELARQSRFRLDAEFVRDNALAISGLLVRQVGGASAKPYQPAGYWENLNFPVREWEASAGENQWRRGLYTWWQRSYLHPSLAAFDAPSREECVAERTRSNIPQQALVLLNDPTYVEAARAFAARILREGGTDTARRIEWAFRQALGRAPRPDEAATVGALFGKHSAAPATELEAWTSVARVILNLHETITRS